VVGGWRQRGILRVLCVLLLTLNDWTVAGAIRILVEAAGCRHLWRAAVIAFVNVWRCWLALHLVAVDLSTLMRVGVRALL